MTQDSQEFEPKEPVKEVELGRWFKPFEEYENIPYEFHRADYRFKSKAVRVKGLDQFEVALHWDEGDFLFDDEKTKHLLVLPQGETLISESQIKKEAEKMETKFMQLAGFRTDYNSKLAKETSSGLTPTTEDPIGTKYSVEVQLPSGTVIESKVFLSNDGVDNWTVGTSFTNVEFATYKVRSILIPENEFILGKIQMRLLEHPETQT